MLEESSVFVSDFSESIAFQELPVLTTTGDPFPRHVAANGPVRFNVTLNENALLGRASVRFLGDQLL